jgi:two-component system chemotaxis sensor kinase CheA
MNDTGKYTAEVNSVLLNLKIGIQEFQKKPGNQQKQEVIKELFKQISELAAIYGNSSMMDMANKASKLIIKILKKEIEADDSVVDICGNVEKILEKLIDDPMLKGDSMKKDYEGTIRNLERYVNEYSNNDNLGEKEKLANSRFQDVFVEEAYDLINQLEEKMLQLESDPSDETMINDVFRIMHTLKGNSNMFGYTYLGEVTHQLENIYDAIRSKKLQNSRPILEITLACVDHFRNLIDDFELNNIENKDQHENMLSEIRNILSEDLVVDTKKTILEKTGVINKTATYYIYFKPEVDVFRDGTNPLFLIHDLHEIGNCLPLPVLTDIPLDAGYNPERCYTQWHILLVSDCTQDDLKDHFMFLRDDCQPKISILSSDNLIGDHTFVEFFKEEAKKNTFLAHLNVEQLHKEKDTKMAHTSKVEAKERNGSDSISSVRVSAQKIDTMMNLVSELVTKQAELSMLAFEQLDPKLQEVAESIENISRDLRDNAFSISLIPIEKSLLRFQRLVRDVSGHFNKKVEFIVEGKETELDKTMVEKIVDPIMHILRNSIDHGIEMPAERIRKGKPETGTIRMKAFASGANVVIEISDDGAGIDLDKVKQTAIAKGYIDERENPKKEDLMNLIISPGFSTAENISEVSGRGVGMDVVNQKVAEIRGELEIYTQKDEGTTITIKLPLTISIIDSMLCKVSGDYYLVPLSFVDRCDEVNATAIIESDLKYLVLKDEFIPFIDLRKEFSIITERPLLQQVILVNYKDMKVGLIVDEVVGNYQAVLKTLGSAYKKQEIISGACILGTGEVALVLDTNKLVQEFAVLNDQRINSLV